MLLVEDAGHNFIADLTIGEIILAAATLGAIVALVMKLGPLFRRINELLDDWFGEKARPGVKGRKGVMERLSDQDDALSQVKPVIDPATEGNHQEVLRHLSDIESATHRNATHLQRVERLLMRHIRESRHWVGEVTAKAKESDFEVPPWPNIPDPPDDEEDPDAPARH